MKRALFFAVLMLAACGNADPEPQVYTPPTLDIPLAPAGSFVASKNREPFHRPGCKWALRISGGNLQTFNSRAAAEAAGHRPCKVCRP